MRRSNPALDDLSRCVGAFDKQLREAAQSLARAIIRKEIRRRLHSAENAAVRDDTNEVAGQAVPLAFEEQQASAPASPTAIGSIATNTTDQPVAMPSGPPRGEVVTSTSVENAEPERRVPWTRQRVVDELARWIVAMPKLDAASIGRRGGTALVNAARREFGRFEAAMNAANVALARRFPDGVPKPGQLPPLASTTAPG